MTVKYVDDQGDEWSIWADKATIEVAGQGVKLGATAADDSLPPIPRELKPRWAPFVDASNNVRRVICYTAACAAFATPGTTLSMSLYRGSTVAPTSFTRAGKGHAERFRGKIVDAPTIS